ncbi:MAG: phosphoribosylformylglycinamidine synthase subunit PurS [Candidatus Muiribacteriota bacterium]|jgi:phosphoribosylformylglycinamidine synthase
MINARILITPKPGILDPQGKAIKLGLHNLNHNEVESVVTGKIMDIKIKHSNLKQAESQIKDMCDRLLANPHMENYKILEIKEG